MLGQIGGDNEGQEYIQYFKENNIDTSHILTKADSVTGQAFIMSMTASGENSIVIVGGANQAFDSHDLPESWASVIESSDLLLMQREIPENINIAACKVAKSAGKTITTVLDVGGMDTKISEDLLKHINIISPNETELDRLITSITQKDTCEIESLKNDKIQALLNELRPPKEQLEPMKPLKYRAASFKDDIDLKIFTVCQVYPQMNILFKRGSSGSTYYKYDDSK